MISDVYVHSFIVVSSSRSLLLLLFFLPYRVIIVRQTVTKGPSMVPSTITQANIHKLYSFIIFFSRLTKHNINMAVRYSFTLFLYLFVLVLVASHFDKRVSITDLLESPLLHTYSFLYHHKRDWFKQLDICTGSFWLVLIMFMIIILAFKKMGLLPTFRLYIDLFVE